MKKNTQAGNIVKIVVITLVAAAIYYYLALPAINIHEPGFWMFFFFIAAFLAVRAFLKSLQTSPDKKNVELAEYKVKENHVKVYSIIAAVIFGVYLIGSLLSSQIINAARYQKLIAPETRDFTDDIEEISYEEIPLLDKDSASLLAIRKMGSMVEYVSQFEVVSDNYQINYKGSPYRVTSLEYGNFFKWISNTSQGIPAYIKINMADQSVECVKLAEGMKYSNSEYFLRYIPRYLRFHYPTYMFEDIHFEIDDAGTPYWVCPVKDYTIGLFGGKTISRVVLCNAITGELQNYALEEVPQWVDRVFSAELLISYYDYYGTLKHGWLNTLFSAKDCLQTTDGYNYIALEDDVWVYTGITSVGSDESNVGFVLMNQRTAETRYYEVPGAEEYSAMASAEGQVQNLGYHATFPLLLNISGEPTYFISLKDDAGLVKKYAMVNIGKYNIVSIGDTVQSCEMAYLDLMRSNNIMINETPVPELVSDKTVSGTIRTIYPVTENGSTVFYVTLEQTDTLMRIDPSVTLDVVRCAVGDKVTLEYYETEAYGVVTGLKLP
ncbi:MAG: CvpA family protein [Lachnospiraceae bacterium]|nr:CvpA family protein [Lachnospiraceae bacterium]